MLSQFLRRRFQPTGHGASPLAKCRPVPPRARAGCLPSLSRAAERGVYTERRPSPGPPAGSAGLRKRGRRGMMRLPLPRRRSACVGRRLALCASRCVARAALADVLRCDRVMSVGGVPVWPALVRHGGLDKVRSLSRDPVIALKGSIYHVIG